MVRRDIMFMYLGGIIFIDVREQDKFERLSVRDCPVVSSFNLY